MKVHSFSRPLSPTVIGAPPARIAVLCTVLLAVATAPAAAQVCNNVDCNSTTVTAVLFPDTPATIYVNVRTLCGAEIQNSCQVSFVSPPTLDPRLKCADLVQALSTGDCFAAGYEVSADLCAAATPPFFVVRDPDAPQSLVEVGITCDPNVFSQTGQGQPICDYEGDVITPGDNSTGTVCVSDEPTATDVTVRGTATGTSIVTSMPGAPPHFGVLVTARRDLPPLDLQIPTAPGMTGEQIVAQAFELLQGLPIEVEVVNDGRTLRFGRDAAGVQVGAGGATNDTGITHAVIGGQASTMPTEFPPPFGSLGECISTRIAERCAGLRGKARAACNHDQQAECRLLFE